MTTHRGSICAKCGTHYYFQGSGWMSDEDSKLNDPKHCPECMALIVNALAPVKLKYDTVRSDASTEVTREQLLEWKKEDDKPIPPDDCDKCKKKNTRFKPRFNLNMRRVFPGLFNSRTRDHSHMQLIRGYYLDEWELSPEYTITKEIRYKVQYDENGERIWNDYSIPEDPNLPFVKPVILMNPDKSYPPENPMEFIGVRAMLPPAGLAIALRTTFKEELDK